MAQQVTAVRDWLGNESAMQATISYEYELNGNQSISATILPSRTNKVFIDDITELWTVIDHFGVEQKIIYLQRKGEGREQVVQIKGVPLFFDVLDTSRIYDRYDEHMTAQLAFTRIFDGLPFAFVLADSFDAVAWEGFGDGESRLETFKRALDRYGAEFRIVGNTVYLHRLIGRDLQVQYRHRLNASNITLENDATGMWTYAKGFGDYGDGEGGEDWQNAKLVREYTSPLAQIPGIGVRHAPPIKDGRVKIAKEMDAKLKTLVDESLKVSVTADIHDLRKHGYPIAQPEVGDRVFLIDERIGLNDEVRAVDLSLVLDWRGNVRDIQITFGTPGLTRRQQARVSAAIDAINDLFDGNRRLPAAAVYDEAMRNAVNAIHNAQTELVFPVQGGIIAMDKIDPNKQVWYNAGGLMVSTDGGATAKAAITGEGVVTEMLTAGTINANRITVRGGDNVNYSVLSGGTFKSYGMREGVPQEITIERGGVKATDMGVLRNGVFYGERGHVTLRAYGKRYDAAASPGNVFLQGDGEVYCTAIQDETKRIPLHASAFRIKDWTYLERNVWGTYGGGIDDMFVQPSALGRLRVMAAYNDSHSYRPVAAGGFQIPEWSFFERNVWSTYGGGVEDMYIRPSGVGSLRVMTAYGEGYRPVLASAFTVNSLAESKQDIKVWTGSALQKIREMPIYEYRLKSEVESGIGRVRQGLVIGEGYGTNAGLVEGEGIEQYLMNTWNMRAIQELDGKLEALEERIDELEAKA